MFNRVSSQDVSASYASIGIVRVTVAAARQAAAPLAAPDASANRDRVSLSPRALAGSPGTGARPAAAADDAPAAPPEGAGTTAPSNNPANTPAAAPAPSRAARLADVLVQALDANRDGTLSEREFVEGARALLGRGRTRRPGRHDDHDGVRGDSEAAGRSEHGARDGRGRRLERRLDRAFDRIDADDNGSLDAGELTAALARVSGRKSSAAPSPEAPPPAAPLPAGGGNGTLANGSVPLPGNPGAAPTSDPPTAPASATAPADAPSTSGGSLFSFSVTTVTFVSVAVQRYQAVDQLQA